MMQTAKGIIVTCWIVLGLLLVPNVAYAQSSNLPENVLQATVKVLIVDPDQKRAISSGSGSIISAEGLVLTNYHVVDESVEKYDGVVVIDMPADQRASRFDSYIGHVLTYDPDADLAVVQITHTLEGEALDQEEFPFIPRGSSRDLMESDQVYAIGYPDIANGRRSVTQGIVSAIWEEEGWILSDVDISNGNSGGPLLSVEGRLIGIPTWGETGERSGEVLGYSRLIEAAEPIIEAAVDMITENGGESPSDNIFCADVFSSNSGDWPLGFDENDSLRREDRIAEGWLYSSIQFKRDVYAWLNVPTCTAKDFVLVVDAQLHRSAADSNGIVIIFRKQEDEQEGNNYYTVTYFRDGSYEVKLRYAGEWKTLKERTPSRFIHLGHDEVNRLAILMVGIEFKIFANGELLTTIRNDVLQGAGGFGLGALGDADETIHVSFDNFFVADHLPEGMIFYDYFIDNHNDWLLGRVNGDFVNCEDEIANEQLEHRIVAKAGNRTCFSTTPNLTAKDFWLEVDVAMLDAPQTGRWLNIAFRYDRETEHRYQLRIDAEDRYTLELYSDEEWHTLQRWTRSSIIDLADGRSHTIQLWVRGSEITLYVNEIELTTIIDHRLATEGTIMLGLGAEEGLTNHVVYDNLVVYETRPTSDR